MININDAHQWVLKTLKKNYGGFLSPSDIDRAIHSASLDCFNQQMKLYKEIRKIPALLKTFKSKATSAPTLGIINISSADAEVFAVSVTVGGKEYPAKIVESEEDWVSRKFEDMEVNPVTKLPLNHYLQEVEVTANDQELPEDFLGLQYAYVIETATSKRYEILTPDPKSFEKKTEDQIVPDPQRPDDPLHLNRRRETYTGTEINAGGALPGNFVEPISVNITIASTGGQYEAIIVPADKFYTKQLEELVGPSNKGLEMDYMFTKTEPYALTAASNQFSDLPDNFVDHLTIFFKDAQNQLHEGDILSEHEFAERVDSAILTPDTDNPIARIVGNQIEFFPKPTGADTYNYVLSYKAFPVAERPLVKIEDDKIYMRPALQAADSVDLVYLEHPAPKRPILRVKANSFEIEPFNGTDYDYFVGFYQYPVLERPIARISNDDASSEVDVEVYPAGVDNITAYYLAKPTKPVFGYTSSNGVITYNAGTSTDLNWDERAFNLIMTRALFYLGYEIKDGEVVQIPLVRNQIEQSQDRI